jgi:uncharacterized protein YggE
MRTLGWRAAVCLSAFAAAVTTPALALAQETTPTIRVRGQAEVRVVPDEVVLTFGIETLHKQVEEAKADNDKRLAALTTAATSHGVPAARVKADYLEIRPTYRDEYRLTEFLGYRARRTVVITLRNLSRFESLVTAALNGGVNYVHGIDFRTTELRKHRDAARAAAVTAASDKAQAMAARLGQEVGAPQQIEEGYGGFYSPFGAWGARREGVSQVSSQAAITAGEVDSTLLPGQIAVTADVMVTFRLK